MYEIDRNSFEKKIATTRFAENEDSNKTIKSSLLAIIKELCDCTRQVNQSLVDDARKQETPRQIKDVFTVLLPVGADAAYETTVGLYKMDSVSEVLDCEYGETDGTDGNLSRRRTTDKTKYQYDRVFLDCEYDEIRGIDGDLSGEERTYRGRYVCKKDGETGAFDYCLEFDNSFLKAQGMLFDFAELYRVENPVVLSPYSRKSFFVKYAKDLCKDDFELDFCFAENHIPVIEGRNSLYWNIRQSIENERAYDAKAPYGDATKFIYRFRKTKKGNLPLPLPLNNQTRVYSINVTEDGVDIATSREVDDFLIYEYLDFDLNSGLAKERQSKQLLFSNETVNGTGRRRRILAEGDIERAIGCFSGWRAARCERSEGGGIVIPRYSKKYCVDRKAKNMFNAIRRECVSFKGTKNRRFLADFANYVLEYLEYYYPEIEWVGEE